jgi:hypothetical protein
VENLGGRSQYLSTAVWWSNTRDPRLDAGDELMIWGWVKTLVPSEPQNSWDLWMFIPLKMYL